MLLFVWHHLHRYSNCEMPRASLPKSVRSHRVRMRCHKSTIAKTHGGKESDSWYWQALHLKYQGWHHKIGQLRTCHYDAQFGWGYLLISLNCRSFDWIVRVPPVREREPERIIVAVHRRGRPELQSQVATKQHLFQIERQYKDLRFWKHTKSFIVLWV